MRTLQQPRAPRQENAHLITALATPAHHPAASLFPMMAPERLDELVADIKAHGLVKPIEMAYVTPEAAGAAIGTLPVTSPSPEVCRERLGRRPG